MAHIPQSLKVLMQTVEACKRKLVRRVLHCGDPDIAVLAEAWLNDSIYNNEFAPADYSVLRKDRGGKGRGVLIVFIILGMPEVPNTECIFCRAYHSNVRYIVEHSVGCLDYLSLSWITKK